MFLRMLSTMYFAYLSAQRQMEKEVKKKKKVNKGMARNSNTKKTPEEGLATNA